MIACTETTGGAGSTLWRPHRWLRAVGAPRAAAAPGAPGSRGREQQQDSSDRFRV